MKDYRKQGIIMYHPTSRVLAVLELLQSRPSISGPELAARLEMDVRTVRRYIMHLQDVGIPVEANIGRYGGARARPRLFTSPPRFSGGGTTAGYCGPVGTGRAGGGGATVGGMRAASRVCPRRRPPPRGRR